MRIAVSVSHFPVLAETFILNRITGLLKRGHEVDIYAYHPEQGGKAHEDIFRWDLTKKTIYWNIPENRISRFLKASLLFPSAVSAAPAAALSSLNFFKYGKEALSLRLFFGCLPLFRERPVYDIVHSHHGPNGLKDTFLREIGAFTGRHVTSFHGADLSRHLCLHGDNVYGRLYEKCDLFLCVSHAMAEKLCSLGCPSGKIRVHHSGIETARFEFRPKQFRQGEILRLLSIGRLVEKKGFEHGIKAVHVLVQKGLRVSYAIAGAGPEEPVLRRTIKSFGLESVVTLLGARTQDEIVSMIHDYQMLLAPSVTASDGNAEGIPNVLKEAMAAGLICAASEHSGIPELIAEGETGFLCAEGNADSLAAAVERALSRRNEWNFIQTKARARIESEYDAEKLNDRLVDIYRSLL